MRGNRDLDKVDNGFDLARWNFHVLRRYQLCCRFPCSNTTNLWVYNIFSFLILRWSVQLCSIPLQLCLQCTLCSDWVVFGLVSSIKKTRTWNFWVLVLEFDADNNWKNLGLKISRVLVASCMLTCPNVVLWVVQFVTGTFSLSIECTKIS